MLTGLYIYLSGLYQNRKKERETALFNPLYITQLDVSQQVSLSLNTHFIGNIFRQAPTISFFKNRWAGKIKFPLTKKNIRSSVSISFLRVQRRKFKTIIRDRMRYAGFLTTDLRLSSLYTILF